ncbi:hypothetical protein AB0I66_34800 [Streptomyces sp. NPDC050439]|uniref:hypothetical protein n=1 Tax=unclassified Streptomyces TaxID=2593676 RepID=UPI0034382DEF
MSDTRAEPHPGIAQVYVPTPGPRYARHRRLPYRSISSGRVDIASQSLAIARRAHAAPILPTSHYCAGSVVLATLHRPRQLDRVDTVRISVVLNDLDLGGPLTR